MNWEKVICYDCNLINDYFITVKLGLNLCRCNGCGKYLGNKPNTEEEERKRIKNLNKVNWNDIECTACSSKNYTVTPKGSNLITRCDDCNHFIGCKPQNSKDPLWIMPFGQYKGEEISKIDNPKYFEWLIKESKIKGRLLLALENRLAELIINEK